MAAKPILILGATGKTGRRIADRLAALGVPVRVGSRSAVPAFDWNDRATWKAALDGAGAVYVAYHPDLAVPGASATVSALVDTALGMGVSRLVLLSGRGEQEAQATEAALMRSGADWTILRSAWFNQNFSESAFLDGVLAGTVSLPVGEVGEPFVDAEDIADVAVAALTDDRHTGHLYELTGPRLLTFRQAVAEIAAATGRDIVFNRVAADDFRREGFGAPADVVWLLDELFTRVLDGRNQYLADGVQRALGRAPKDFAAYAREAAASGVWNPAGH